jgi:Ca2+-binding RTX toxin-like protein
VATFFFETMTQADANTYHGAGLGVGSDLIIFSSGPASLATVLFNPLTVNGPPSVTVIYGGNSLTFADDATTIRGQLNLSLFPDNSQLYIGTTGNDSSVGTGGSDGLFGGLGDDTMSGGAGNDLLQGNQGNDVLSGGSGLNTLFGGQGDDSLDLTGGGASASATNFAQGNLGNDIDAGAGNDSITMGTGADTITGGAGNDTIVGGGGMGAGSHDMLSGGGGSDTFIFAAGTSVATLNSAEVITDWNGTTDSLKIGGLGTGVGVYHNDTLSAANFSSAITTADTALQGTHAGDKYIAVQVGTDVVVFADDTGAGHITSADDAIILTGRALSDIVATDFI